MRSACFKRGFKVYTGGVRSSGVRCSLCRSLRSSYVPFPAPQNYPKLLRHSLCSSRVTSLEPFQVETVFCGASSECREAIVQLILSDAAANSGVTADDVVSALVDQCIEFSFSYSFSYGCMEDCPVEVLEVVGDDAAFCALGDLSCIEGEHLHQLVATSCFITTSHAAI